jgi:hypothetical protein
MTFEFDVHLLAIKHAWCESKAGLPQVPLKTWVAELILILCKLV